MEKINWLTVDFPLYLWQELVVMAAQDMRDEREFIKWLVRQESQKRESTLKEIDNRGDNERQ